MLCRQAWQKVGNMNPEVAMEQYINLLSESIPGWMEQLTRVSNTLGRRKVTILLNIYFKKILFEVLYSVMLLCLIGDCQQTR